MHGTALPATLFANLTLLSYIFLDKNRLQTLPYPRFLYGLPSLTSLSITDNQLTSLPADLLEYTPSLRQVDLRTNALTDVNPLLRTAKAAGLSLILVDFSNNPLRGLYEENLPTIETLRIGQVEKPAGNFCSLGEHAERITHGGATVYVCVSCPRGHHCSGNGLLQACPAGSHNDNLGSFNASVCDPCPPGTFSTQPGGTSATCQVCSMGRYSPKSGESSIEACLPCPSGRYGGSVGMRCVNGVCCCNHPACVEQFIKRMSRFECIL